MPPRSEEELPRSTLGLKPLKHRGKDLNIENWLDHKKNVSGAENLWRIHDDIYDLTEFINKHPGGSEWLELTKGLDITEAFEAHHISTYPEQMLSKFFVRKAKTKRHVPYTFKEDGFYRTLKGEIRNALKTTPKQSINTSKFLTDVLMASSLLFSVLANAYWNYWLALLAGVMMGMCAVAAHNYFHKKDNIRMYYFNFTLHTVREWRVSHVLSHHLHTNTVDDMEIAMWDPYLEYLPIQKKPILKYGPMLYAPLVWILTSHLSFTKRILLNIKGVSKFQATDLILLIVPTLMYIFGGQSILATLWMWNVIIFVCSGHFVFVGLHAAHHHPDVFHDGDTPRATGDYDWGLSQLDALMERKEITGSHFLVLTNYGDHALHHLFPTLDHGTLDHLYPVFYDVLKKFDINLRMVSQLDAIAGGFQQLCRVKNNPNPPDLNKSY